MAVFKDGSKNAVYIFPHKKIDFDRQNKSTLRFYNILKPRAVVSGPSHPLAVAFPLAVEFLSVAGGRPKRLSRASLSTVYAYRISFGYDDVGGTAVFVALPWQRGK